MKKPTPPVAKPVGVPVKTDSGRTTIIRINEDHVFRSNMTNAWNRCKEYAEKNNLPNWEIGLAFYMALAEMLDKKN